MTVSVKAQMSMTCFLLLIPLKNDFTPASSKRILVSSVQKALLSMVAQVFRTFLVPRKLDTGLAIEMRGVVITWDKT